MSQAELRMLVVGVGGQGVLTAAQILGVAAHAEGLPVVVGQLHGMSQRGGSVQCTVIVGKAESSFICGGEADVVIALEAIEALRALPWMGPHTRVVASRRLIAPLEVASAHAPVPNLSEIVAQIRATGAEIRMLEPPVSKAAADEGRTLNALMLGAASGFGVLPFSENSLLSAIGTRCGAKYLDANQRAFAWGRDAIRDPRFQA